MSAVQEMCILTEYPKYAQNRVPVNYFGFMFPALEKIALLNENNSYREEFVQN